MEGSKPPRPRERVRLAFGLVCWRLFAAFFVCGELLLWGVIRQAVARPPGTRLALLLGHTPRVMVSAFFLSAVVTVLLDLFVRVAVHEKVRRWVAPRSDEDENRLAFLLDATEPIRDQFPARELRGRGSAPGQLIRTDRRLWFVPRSWDREPWALPLERIKAATSVSSGRAAWGMVQGLPPKLVLTLEGGAQKEFAVADASAVIRALDPGAAEPLLTLS